MNSIPGKLVRMIHNPRPWLLSKTQQAHTPSASGGTP